MSQPSHQIVQLSTGSHRRPEDGVCAMELASMLAGEPFSDRPASVCPVIAAFLRSYNDGVDDRRRRHLYRFASEAVATRGPDSPEERRAELCRRWISDCYPQVAGPPARLVPPAGGRGARRITSRPGWSPAVSRRRTSGATEQAATRQRSRSSSG